MTTLPELLRNERLSASQRERIGAELARRYRDGHSIRALAADSGYSLGRIRRLLLDAGVEPRRRGQPTGPRHRADTSRPPAGPDKRATG